MKKTLWWIPFVVLVCSINVFAQSLEENAARSAEEAGKFDEALTQYVAALQKTADGSPNLDRLCQAAIRVALRMKTRPAISSEARRFFVRGHTAMKDAKSSADFKEAAEEFSHAARLAPWWPDAYFNEAVSYEKAGKFAEAIRSLRFYLVAAPNAPDAEKVQDQISSLEYRQEKAQRELTMARQEQERKAEQQRLARQRDEEERSAIQRRIAGAWYEGDPTQEYTIRYDVTITGNNFELKATFMYVRVNNYAQQPTWVPYKSDLRPPSWQGTIEGLIITGTFYGDTSNWNGGGTFTRPMSGSISPDGRTLRLQYKASAPRGGRFPNPTGWIEIDQDRTFRR